MKKLSIMMLLFCAVMFAGCEKYEYGYIESLEGTVWQTTGSPSIWSIYDFKSTALIWRTEEKDGKSTTRTGLTWYCADDGTVNVYWDQYIGAGPYMKGQFDKYKGTLIMDGSKCKLINK